LRFTVAKLAFFNSLFFKGLGILLVYFLFSAIFLFKKTRLNRKAMSEQAIFDALRRQQVQLPPLTIRLLDEQRPIVPSRIGGDLFEIDAVIAASWDERTWKFAAEIKGLSTPQAFRNAVGAVQPAAQAARLNPMVVMPYLSPESIAALEDRRMSGLDLCGNGVIIVPGELLVVRTGRPNRFPQSDPIRNVYRGDSSMVARAFLAQPVYRAVGAIAEAIRDLGGGVTLPTVSKVLKALEADLIVGRQTGEIRVLQPDKLLDRLAENYRPPKTSDRYVGKAALPERELPLALANAARRVGSKFILTGAASASQYAVLAGEPVVAAYCDRMPEELLSAIGARFERTDRFPNVNLVRTSDAPVYFDSEPKAGVSYASPVQAYLELMSGDKRHRETAEQVRAYVLRRVAERSGRAA
jgi:hypothetical protein